MRSRIVLTVIFLLAAFSAPAVSTWQELSSHLFTNATIVWQASTDGLPKEMWIYRRLLPHVFPSSVISNAMVLGSLEERGFPHPSTNDVFILKEMPPNWPGPIPVLLGIRPADANLYFSSAVISPVVETELPSHERMVARARQCARLLGLDPATLTQEQIYTHDCETEQIVDTMCGRGIFFPRRLDGIAFFSASDDGEGAEGFAMEFGGHEKIQAFNVRWSEVERFKSEATASTEEIGRCMKAHKILVLPDIKGDNVARLKRLTMAKKFTIIRITPFYGEGVFGEEPTNDVPSRFATPFAELEANAEFGNSNTPVRFLSPILAPEVSRLLSGH